MSEHTLNVTTNEARHLLRYLAPVSWPDEPEPVLVQLTLTTEQLQLVQSRLRQWAAVYAADLQHSTLPHEHGALAGDLQELTALQDTLRTAQNGPIPAP